jgi:hypothetical protein
MHLSRFCDSPLDLLRFRMAFCFYHVYIMVASASASLAASGRVTQIQLGMIGLGPDDKRKSVLRLEVFAISWAILASAEAQRSRL